MPWSGVAVLWISSIMAQTWVQESPTGAALAQLQREKAAPPRPQEPDTAERVLEATNNFPILSDSPHGPYPGLHEPCECFEIRGEKLVDQAGIEPATS